MTVPVIPACIEQSYGKFPAVPNVRLTLAFVVFGMLAGAPPPPEKVTLCSTAENVHVTVPPRATPTTCGLNVLAAELAVTVACVPSVPVTTTGTAAVFVTPPKLSETSMVVDPAETPNTTP